MAELLLRVTDKINPDFYLNTKCTKRGDVIVAQVDGWAWGTRELTEPFWRILKIPAMTLAQANSFVSAELDTDPNNPSLTLQRRAFKFDLSKLPARYLPLVDPASRTIESILINETGVENIPAGVIIITIASIMNVIKTTKSPIVDPAVVG